MMDSKFKPDARVRLPSGATGIVERVIYGRNAIRPVYDVRWFHKERPYVFEFEETDLRETETVTVEAPLPSWEHLARKDG